MNARKKQKTIIATLCAIVIGMVVGYAALNQLLSINGTSQISGDFNIQITNIEENTMTNSKTISTSGLGTTTANFTVDLEKPGSSAIYNVTVENKGTIDAILKSISGIDEANTASPTDIKFSIQDLTLEEELLSKATKTFQVKVEWLGTSTSVPETNKTLNLKLNYEQNTEIVYETKTINEQTMALLDSSTTYNYMNGTYLSSAQVSNYVWFDGFMWRVMGINADGSVRMITEENVTAILWGASNKAEQYDVSYINDWLNNYFYPKLKDKNLLVNTTWCSETTTDQNSVKTNCTNNLSTGSKPVGLITLDEYNLANGKNSYLKNAQDFWTITPNSTSRAFYVNKFGIPAQNIVSQLSYGVRPVITISSGTAITSGSGIITDPYMIEDKISDMTGSLKDNSYVGEYVTYAGRNYRVVETSTAGTKLILDGYYDEDNNGVVDEMDKLEYNVDLFDGGCTLCSKINEESFVNWIANNSSIDLSKLVNTTWYRGANWKGGDYKTNLLSTENPYEGKVGLIRVGEMLSGQSETLLSKNHTVVNNYNNVMSYWSSTPFSASDAWHLEYSGDSSNTSVEDKRAIRPVIMISPSTAITSGNGTPNSPYQI